MRTLALAPLLALALLSPDAGLKKLVLQPGQVGGGYKSKTIPMGTRVNGQVTLDLCGRTFKSERLRKARLQIFLTHRGHLPGVSNEVVRYAPGGAQQALAETDKAVATCPKHAVKGA